MEVNFSVKEMRAMLEICEFLSSFVEITYTEPGEPLVTKAVNPSFQVSK